MFQDSHCDQCSGMLICEYPKCCQPHIGASAERKIVFAYVKDTSDNFVITLTQESLLDIQKIINDPDVKVSFVQA